MVPPIRLWDAGRPQRGGAEDHDPQLADARLAGRRPRRRVLGLPDGRAPAGRAVRPVRRRRRRGLLRRRDGRHHRDVPARDPVARSLSGSTSGRTTPSTTASTRRGCTPSGSPSPARRRTTRAASGSSSTSPAPARRPRARSTTAATTPTATSSPSGWRRSCATWPTPRSGWPSSTSTRACCRCSRCASRQKGTLLTPVFPAPTNARTFVILRLLGVLAGVRGQGRRRPDARRPGDDPLHRRVRRRPRRPAVPHARGARRRLGRPLLRRRRGHHPRGARLAEPPDRVHREPVPVPGGGAAAGVSTPAAPGGYRGGLGYEKHIRMLRDAHFMSIADRSILACWGVKGGLAGQPFSGDRSTPAGRRERVVDALADAEPVRAGEVIRIRTTGGGGWGDPLERPYDEVERDVRWGKVSIAGALRDYGVVVTGSEDEPGGRRGRVRRRAGGAQVGPHRRGAVLRPGSGVRPARRGTHRGRGRLGLKRSQAPDGNRARARRPSGGRRGVRGGPARRAGRRRRGRPAHPRASRAGRPARRRARRGTNRPPAAARRTRRRRSRGGCRRHRGARCAGPGRGGRPRPGPRRSWSRVAPAAAPPGGASSSGGSDTAAAGSRTTAPSPCRTSTRPRTSSATRARLRVARLTPRSCASRRSGGSRSPGESPWASMKSAMWSASCSYSRGRVSRAGAPGRRAAPSRPVASAT